jgi:hypothetical protein
VHKKVHGSWMNFFRLVNIIINAFKEKCEDRHYVFLETVRYIQISTSYQLIWGMPVWYDIIHNAT